MTRIPEQIGRESSRAGSVIKSARYDKKSKHHSCNILSRVMHSIVFNSNTIVVYRQKKIIPIGPLLSFGINE
jgi:hypothetical protein